MELSRDMILAQTDAIGSLSKAADGHLSLKARKCIWVAMGPAMEPLLPLKEQVGARRRIQLARLSVEYVLPVWSRRWPNDDGPKQMLVISDALIENSIGRDVAQKQKDQFW